jgi:predicted enzyme related to lactoylglutathione lyase
MANKVMWYEIVGKDGKKLQTFFSELFGWKYKQAPNMTYGMTDPEVTGVGGGVGEFPGASWATFYVGVDDVSQALERAVKLGGKVLTPVTKLPEVTFAVFADPEGHPVGLVEHRQGKAA